MTDVGHQRGKSRWRLMMWGGAAILLLAPAVAMQFTAEMNWGAEDFVAFAALLVAACGAFELATRLTRKRAVLALSALAILGAFLLVWAQLAVGVF